MSIKTGEFYSWNVVNSNIAIKQCDKSFFEYNCTGVPKQICWFFNADNLIYGQSLQVILTFNSKEYAGKLTKDNTESGSVSIIWNKDLGNVFKALYKDNNTYPKATFERIGENKYNITINYSEKIDSPLHDALEKFINEYKSAKEETFTGNTLGNFVRNSIPNILYSKNIFDSSKYLVTGSVGQGNWAIVPWIGIFDCSITTSATKGVYIVYLLSKDTNSLYLTFNQGCTDIRSQNSKQKTISYMREKADEITLNIDGRGFKKDNNINLGEGLTELGELYQKGTIFYKEYHKGLLPSEVELEDDLHRMIQIYQDYVSYKEKRIDNRGEKELSTKEIINNIKTYITSRGFSYDDGLIENFFLSLKSKPFVILAGTSGTGKTRLAKLFAEAVGATEKNNRYKMIPVRPDWSDSSDLFGHVDLSGKFIPGAIIDFVKEAKDHSSLPYFLCLDEMNLARVEYYLSDVLSVIETRDITADGKIVSTTPLVPISYYGSDNDAISKYGEITLPDNLYIIGTVNMDETTFPFSRKVLDRANTIEFSYVNLLPSFEASDTGDISSLDLNNTFLKTEYIILLKHCKDQAEAVQKYCVDLQKLNEILHIADAHVGYRVRDEIVFYLLNNKNADLISQNDALDNEIMQKILPRIQGSSSSIKKMLCDLFKFCAGDFKSYQTEDNDISNEMIKIVENRDNNILYRKSARKIAFMVRRYEEDGFTSYWL